VLATNLAGAAHATRACTEGIRASTNGGVIVNITLTGAVRPQPPEMSAYVASKHALDGFNKACALELGPDGIRVLVVALSLAPTRGIAELTGSAGAEVFSSYLEQLATTVPLRRVATEDDIARLVLFCCSDLARGVSGSSILVDGGSMTI
jgi:NAD(P)-dependent dehydrogenase (short-subunit alcohol dehydrogenase family)